MTPFLCAAAAAAGIALTGCSTTTPDNTQRRSGPDLYASLARRGSSVDSYAARDIISIYRRNQQRSLLRLDPALQRIAEKQVRAMAARGSADARVRSGLKDLLAQEKVRYSFAAQNVSSGYHSLPEAFAGWRQSRPHNANMLNPRARRMGIATAYVPGTKYRVYWALVIAD